MFRFMQNIIDQNLGKIIEDFYISCIYSYEDEY